MDSYDILVVILSVFLGIFLISSIILLTVSIKLVNKIRAITDKADDIMHDVETVSSFFKKSAAPVAITSLISNIVSKVIDHNNKEGKK